MENKRSIDVVEFALNQAKVDTTDMVSFSQPLYFKNNLFDINKFRMLEVPSELADSLSQGQKLVFKGEELESLVICNESNTYDVKEAESSNSFLVLEGIAYDELDAKNDYKKGILCERILFNAEIQGFFKTYLELSLCPPKTNKLRSIFQKPEARYDEVSSRWNPKVGVALSELINDVQCSAMELKQTLNKLQAIRVSSEVENYVDYDETRVFLIQNDYKMKILTLITDFIRRDIELIKSRNSINNPSSLWEGGIDKSRCIRMCNLDGEPTYIVEQIFDYFFTPCEFSCTMEDLKYNPVISYKVCKEKVYRFCGECIFPEDCSFQQGYDVDEFCSVWQDSVDIHFGIDISEGSSYGKIDISRDLTGLALLDSKKNKVIYLPEWKLPLDIKERFQYLFKYREKWSLHDITPYIENLVPKQTNAYALISKYSRVITAKDGTKLFCSKYGK